MSGPMRGRHEAAITVTYRLANLAAGWRLKPFGMLKDLSLQANVSNLFDKKYPGTIGTSGFVALNGKR